MENNNSNDKSSFIDLTFDFGFKIAFANPEYPELLRRLLQELIPERTITSIEFLNPEVLGPDENGKKTRYDIRCHEPDKTSFIVEMQKKSYRYFPDRLLVYSGEPIRELLKAGEEYTEVRPLYIVSILDHILKLDGEGNDSRKQLVRRASIRMDDSKNILTDKLNFIFLQLPVGRQDTVGQKFLNDWAVSVREMQKCEGVAKELKDGSDGEYFKLLETASNRQNIRNNVLTIYDRMVRDEIQIKAERDYAVEEAREEALAEGLAKGLAEGEAKGRAEGIAVGRTEAIKNTAVRMKEKGLDVVLIAELTGLSEVEITGL